MPERAGIFVDFDQVSEMARVGAQGFRLRPAQIELAKASLLPKILAESPRAWSAEKSRWSDEAIPA